VLTLKGALIKSIFYKGGINGDGEDMYRLEVERVVEVSSEMSLKDIKKMGEYPYVMIVDENVKPGMIYNPETDAIYTWTGYRVYPPASTIETINKLVNEVNEITYNVDTSSLTLEELKDYLIRKNKYNLEKYLDNHPMLDESGRVYTVTSDKQNQLTGVLNAYTLARAAGMEVPLTWNERGQECTPYAFEELVSLYLQMLAYVKPIVTYQQHAEIEIKAAETIEAALAVDIDFEGYENPFPTVAEDEMNGTPDAGEQIQSEGSDDLEPVETETEDTND
jgi:hypothetical protein